MELQAGERLDDLLTHDLKIIQSGEVFSFSLDAVLLARFCTAPKRGKLLDLCSGNGVIPLLLSTRTQADLTGIEIQERLAGMARRSVQINGLENRLDIMCMDLREAHLHLGRGQYDLVTVNPPYLPARTGDTNLNPHVAIARHEIMCTLEEVIAACGRLVRSGGKVAMVHRPSRLADLLVLMRGSRLEPKRLRFVHPRAGAEANMVLIEAIRDGGPEIRLLPPLMVYEDDGRYCRELLEVYYGKTDRLDGREEQEG